MQNTSATLPLATRNPVTIMNLPGASNPIASIAGSGLSRAESAVSSQASPSQMSWSAVLKAVHGGHHGVHRTGINNIQTSTDSGVDGFGAAATSDDTSVDSFGAPSAKPSSTSNLVAAISDPFTSIASNLAVQAQLGSPSALLDL
jgi:hypothetical protein